MKIIGTNGISIDISEQQINNFKKLRSIAYKMDFWQNQLKIPYFFWYLFPYQEIKEIMIQPKDSEEIETLNTLTIEKYEERYKHFKSPLCLFDTKLKENLFIKNIEKSKNRTLFKEHEFQKIKEEINIFINRNESPLLNIKNFIECSYFNYLHNNQKPDYSTNNWELPHLIAIENGYRLAQYHFIVENYKPTNLIELSLPEKILLLEYLGILDVLKNKLSINMIAKTLNTLTGMDISNIEKTYRDSYIKQLHKPQNRSKVIEYLEQIGLKDLSNEIKIKENFID